MAAGGGGRLPGYVNPSQAGHRGPQRNLAYAAQPGGGMSVQTFEGNGFQHRQVVYRPQGEFGDGTVVPGSKALGPLTALSEEKW